MKSVKCALKLIVLFLPYASLSTWSESLVLICHVMSCHVMSCYVMLFDSNVIMNCVSTSESLVALNQINEKVLDLAFGC